MKVCIHRGTQEIGGTCIEIEVDGKRIALDLGLPLDADEYESEEALLPKVKGFDGNNPEFLGLIISHPHQDHYGLSHLVHPDVPVIIGKAARNILQAAMHFTSSGADFKNVCFLKDRVVLTQGPFKITPFLVDHSAYDAYSLLIEGNGKRLFYSGDFRAHGRKAKLFSKLVSDPPQGIDILLMEGTTLGRSNSNEGFQTEDDLVSKFEHEFKQIKGLALVWCSGQNIDRLVTIFKASRKARRQLILDMYTAEILRATGNSKLPQADWEGIRVFLPKSQKRQIIEKRLFEISNRYKPYRIYPEDLAKETSRSVILFRPRMKKDLENAGCLCGAGFIYSLWEGYLRMPKQNNFLNWLKEKEIPLTRIHTSGHASAGDLQKLALALKPKVLVPIHSFATDRFPDFLTG